MWVGNNQSGCRRIHLSFIIKIPVPHIWRFYFSRIGMGPPNLYFYNDRSRTGRIHFQRLSRVARKPRLLAIGWRGISQQTPPGEARGPGFRLEPRRPRGSEAGAAAGVVPSLHLCTFTRLAQTNPRLRAIELMTKYLVSEITRPDSAVSRAAFILQVSLAAKMRTKSRQQTHAHRRCVNREIMILKPPAGHLGRGWRAPGSADQP